MGRARKKLVVDVEAEQVPVLGIVAQHGLGSKHKSAWISVAGLLLPVDIGVFNRLFKLQKEVLELAR